MWVTLCVPEPFAVWRVCVCVLVSCPTAAPEAVRAGLAGVCLDSARPVSALWWQYHMTQALCHHPPLMQWCSEAQPGPRRAPQSRSLESERVLQRTSDRQNKWEGRTSEREFDWQWKQVSEGLPQRKCTEVSHLILNSFDGFNRDFFFLFAGLVG